MVTFDQKLIEKLNEWQPGGWPVGNLLACIIALVLCVILVGIVGIERERRGRSAGLRTHLLVGVGSTIIMIISIYGFPSVFSEKRDVARLAAQVITGVGFLGAGAIMHRESGVKGLTTAGTIWVSMAIGVACGSFNFLLAIAGTLLIFFILTGFRKVETRIARKNPTISLVSNSEVPVLEGILKVSEEFDCKVSGISTSNVEGSDSIQVTFQVLFEEGGDRLDEYLTELGKVTKAKNVHLLSHK